MGINSVIKRGLAGVLPVALVQSLAGEFRITRHHARSSLQNRARYRGASNLLVNVGCGSLPIPGWVNVDLINAPDILYWDCRRSLPFDDNSVRFIFAEHVFEHLDHPIETSRFLAECLRVLQPGGLVRLVVPDAGRYLKLYSDEGWQELADIRPLIKTENGYKDRWLDTHYLTKMEMMNAIFRQHGEHKYAYDAETLMLRTTQAGFSRSVLQSYGQSLHGPVPDRADRGPESLYVEAVK